MHHKREAGLPFSNTLAADKYSGDHHPRRLSKLFFTSLLVFSSFLLALCLLSAGDNRRDFIHLQLQQFNRAVQGPPPPPAPASTSLDHVLFGIGGSSSSWPYRKNYTELWWRPNRTRGYVWFDVLPGATASDGKLPAYKVSEDASRFPYTCWYGSRPAVRLSRIIVESVRLREEGVRWYVIGDDDTVFFADNLVAVLNKYDHTQMYYIGGVSESVEQAVVHSYSMAYGGGGFAISAMLAEELVRIFDGCLHRYASLYGSDQRVGACVNELGVSLTREPGFHQMDVRGEAYGLLAAHPVAPLVSLHHLDYVNPIFPSSPTKFDAVGSLLAASRVDSGRTLQQSFGYMPATNWSVSLSWGFTVQLYPSLLTPKELATAFQTFASWRTWRSEPFTLDTRPWEAKPCRQPILYFLEKVEGVDGSNGSATFTVYKKFNDVQRPYCDEDGYFEARQVERVEVFAPKMDLSEWKKAPRRYCSKIDAEVRNGTLTMELEKCSHTGENLSPR